MCGLSFVVYDLLLQTRQVFIPTLAASERARPFKLVVSFFHFSSCYFDYYFVVPFFAIIEGPFLLAIPQFVAAILTVSYHSISFHVCSLWPAADAAVHQSRHSGHGAVEAAQAARIQQRA